jgi:hypothetical protein
VAQAAICAREPAVSARRIFTACASIERFVTLRLHVAGVRSTTIIAMGSVAEPNF